MRSGGDAELVDSSPLVDDCQALRQRIAEDGYVFFRGLLDRARIESIGNSGLTALQEEGWLVAGVDPVTAAPQPPVRAVRMRDAFTDRGYQRVLFDPDFNRIPFDSPLTDVMGQILGPAGVCYPLKLPRIVYPSRLVPRQPGGFVHKDYRSVQDMFTSWVPLGAVPASLGGLAVLPGSQRSSTVAPRPLERLERGWRTTDYEPGDVLVFHCMTTHAALPNREQRMRFSAEYRWQLADQPAPRRMVLAPQGQELGSRAFGHTRWWRPVLPRLTLFDDGGGDAAPRLPAPPSRYVTTTT
jgi:hypothetical protein